MIRIKEHRKTHVKSCNVSGYLRKGHRAGKTTAKPREHLKHLRLPQLSLGHLKRRPVKDLLRR